MEKVFKNFTELYLKNLVSSFEPKIIEKIEILANDLNLSWKNGANVFICGNGGSAGNAMHIANDFHYGVGCKRDPQSNDIKNKPGIKIIALPSNPSIITCLANDIGYENIYSHQLKVLGNLNDILIVLSGSGNSKNVINAIVEAHKIGIKTYSITAFDGGKCKEISKENIHFEINDMQIAEDTQLILFHMCMQWLSNTNNQEIE
ncbi:putative phosphoheptose isomerase [Prochlorococcus marinus subsp. pastoris str. CCMP1986]|uniref:Putative phosphoheptose isomerase n=1 Tax=Prochlorococcus marinus subsp. pastoris (strain CCMP1986 / NIES-2087 / MED4) TaxID=59919 RepID=Q7V0N9_PROMP|nr:SIS domain-containing protein [Prochlorococcus marinus]KGF87222.1 Phosphoheptose isomerase [Prochlorococcus marinus str. EQPAC1]CAE19676.1 putative phosphoheptose isomerase [Prochlorococcus marinus subsp. pastoris str. CCMP1986]